MVRDIDPPVETCYFPQNDYIDVEVKLLAKPDFDAAQLAGLGAAICYRGRFPEKSLQVAMDGGHYSVLEHANYTFEITHLSRVALAQLTRHRIASYSVESQRYVGMDTHQVIIPTSFNKDAEIMNKFYEGMKIMINAYQEGLEKGYPKEDLRYFLPQGIETTLLVTMNARELRHFFELRCCNRAQWEIRRLADRMLNICKEVSPELFADAGPACVRGKCHEGKHSCGRPREDLMGII